MLVQHYVGVAVMLMVTVVTTKAEWSYIVLSPGELRAGLPYDVTVSIIKGGITDVQLSLKTTKDDSGTTLDSKAVSIDSGSSKMVELKYTPSGTFYGNVYLHVSGSGGNNFNNVTRVKVTQQTSFMMIQTDKGIYKPSTIVRGNVLVADPEVKPKNLKVDITVSDPKGNKIEEWKEQQTNAGGFVSFSFGLSDRPPLGVWIIEAYVSGNRVIMDRVNITVDEYVLPRFEVKIEEVPSYVHAHTPATLTFKVKAMYTYGEPVVGKAEVTLKFSPARILPAKDLSKSGEATFSQSITGSGADHEVEIIAVVTETKSGETQSSNSKTMISYKQYPISMKIVHKDKFFMPNSTYHYQVVFTDPVGKNYPVDRLGNDLKLTVQYQTDWNTRNAPEESLEDPLSSNIVNVAKYVSGAPLFLKFNVYLRQKSTRNNIATVYEEYAGVYVSRSKTRIQVDRVGGDDVKVKSGNTVTFKADVPNNIGTVYYVLYSRGMFTGHGAQLTNGQTTATISIQTTTDMSPSSVLIVYGFDGTTGEMLIASKRFSITGILKNQIQMSFSQNRQKPGSEATITITADPDSTVALVAVDKSSLLLAAANDITVDGVETALDIFDLAMKKMQQNKPMIWQDCNCDAYTTTRIIQLLGFNVMTNAYMHFVPVYEKPDIVFDDAPMFGVVAEAAIGPGSDGSRTEKTSPAVESSRVRRYFPETWIWISDSVGPTGRLQVKKTVPDSITSWVATAFGSSQNTGLGIAQKANLEAFQSMFINLRMPYAAIRGESLELKIQVYNYENQKHVANIKLERSEDFGIWLANENREQVMAKSQDFTASMEIMPNNSNVVSVWIEASKIKTMTLKVSASFQGTTISDIVERQLLVKPEGQTVHKTKQILLKLDDKKPMISEQAQVVVPADFIPDSLFIKTTLIGNIMGAALDGLDSLVRMPFGCGEQNMISLVPNIYVRDYLSATNELTVELQELTDKYMKYGLQRELGYRHNDGSFSAFGTSDPSGSSWLTAFVMKSFSQAKKYIFVDPEIIRKATMFLTGHFSSSSGEFSEPGRVIHSEMQGGAANGPALTAYIVISLLEGLDALDASVQQQVRSQAITPAINTLKNNFDKDKTTMKPYMLALTAYALSLYGDPKVTEVLQILESLAKVGNGTKCWGDYCLGSDKPVPMANAKMAMDYIIIKPKANTVEIAAYVLLAYIKVNDINKAQPVLNWLVSQMSDIGGFHSTQDTVLGLQALSTFAAKSTQNLNVNVEVSHGTTVHTFPMVTNNNKNMLQRQQIPSDVRSIDIKATGSGTVLLTLVWQYNMKKDLSTQEIDLTVTTSPMNDNNRYKLDICSKYVGKGGSGQMAIVKVEVATGYVADTEKTKKDRNIKRVEEENGIVNIYFDDLDNLKCTSMYASKVENVGEIQPRSVTTQLYYEPETQNVVFYQAQTQQVNCNSDTCSTKGPVGGVGSNGTSVMFFLLCIMVALLV